MAMAEEAAVPLGADVLSQIFKNLEEIRDVAACHFVDKTWLLASVSGAKRLRCVNSPSADAKELVQAVSKFLQFTRAKSQQLTGGEQQQAGRSLQSLILHASAGEFSRVDLTEVIALAGEQLTELAVSSDSGDSLAPHPQMPDGDLARVTMVLNSRLPRLQTLHFQGSARSRRHGVDQGLAVSGLQFPDRMAGLQRLSLRSVCLSMRALQRLVALLPELRSLSLESVRLARLPDREDDESLTLASATLEAVTMTDIEDVYQDEEGDLVLDTPRLRHLDLDLDSCFEGVDIARGAGGLVELCLEGRAVHLEYVRVGGRAWHSWGPGVSAPAFPELHHLSAVSEGEISLNWLAQNTPELRTLDCEVTVNPITGEHQCRCTDINDFNWTLLRWRRLTFMQCCCCTDFSRLLLEASKVFGPPPGVFQRLHYMKVHWDELLLDAAAWARLMFHLQFQCKILVMSGEEPAGFADPPEFTGKAESQAMVDVLQSEYPDMKIRLSIPSIDERQELPVPPVLHSGRKPFWFQDSIEPPSEWSCSMRLFGNNASSSESFWETVSEGDE